MIFEREKYGIKFLCLLCHTRMPIAFWTELSDFISYLYLVTVFPYLLSKCEILSSRIIQIPTLVPQTYTCTKINSFCSCIRIIDNLWNEMIASCQKKCIYTQLCAFYREFTDTKFIALVQENWYELLLALVWMARTA